MPLDCSRWTERPGPSSRWRSSQAPPHERGAFPTWLHENGATVILAGGMGPRAVQMFEQFGIQVVAGVGGEDPQAVVKAFLSGDLVSTGETCSGGHLHACGDHGHEGG